MKKILFFLFLFFMSCKTPQKPESVQRAELGHECCKQSENGCDFWSNVGCPKD